MYGEVFWVMVYTLDLTPIQASIVAQLVTVSGLTVIPDGLMDEDSDRIPRDAAGRVGPFLLVWFRSLNRSNNGDSFGGTRMDGYRSGFDLVSVAQDGQTARENLNMVADAMIGWKPVNSGQIVKLRSLFEGSRAVLDSASKPSRYAATDRYDFGVFAKRSTP